MVFFHHLEDHSPVKVPTSYSYTTHKTINQSIVTLESLCNLTVPLFFEKLITGDVLFVICQCKTQMMFNKSTVGTLRQTDLWLLFKSTIMFCSSFCDTCWRIWLPLSKLLVCYFSVTRHFNWPQGVLIVLNLNMAISRPRLAFRPFKKIPKSIFHILRKTNVFSLLLMCIGYDAVSVSHIFRADLSISIYSSSFEKPI